MISSTATKVLAVTVPVAIVDNTSWTTLSIDTVGWDQCDIYVMFGAMDIAMVAMLVSEADADSGYVAISSLTAVGTTGDGRLPTATDDGLIFCFEISMLGRKRFLDLTLTGGDGAAGTYAVAWAVLSRGKEMPDTTAERGLAGRLRYPA